MDIEEDLKKSLQILREGGVILYPTDTIWGLGCDATDSAAVEKIFSIKSRSDSKSLIILVDGLTMLERYTDEIPEIAYELVSASDAPLTVIYPSGKNLAPAVCSNDGSVAIRICKEKFCSELLKRFRKPLVSTSANISGDPPPQVFGEINKKIVESAGYAVEYRRDDIKKRSPSSIIKIEKNGVFKIIRE